MNPVSRREPVYTGYKKDMIFLSLPGVGIKSVISQDIFDPNIVYHNLFCKYFVYFVSLLHLVCFQLFFHIRGLPQVFSNLRDEKRIFINKYCFN